MNPKEPTPAPIPESEMKAEMDKLLGKQAAANPKLQKIPPQFQKFFQGMSRDGKDEERPIDLSNGRARPEEIQVLMAEGWDGKSPLPHNIAELRAAKMSRKQMEEKLIQDMEKRESLSVEEMPVVPFEKAPEEMQKAFTDMIDSFSQPGAMPKIINKKAPEPVKAQPVSGGNISVANLLKNQPQQQAAPAKQPEQPAPQPATQTGAVNKPDPICPRCHYDTSKPYEVKPTDEDIENRLLSIISSTRNGDGRFRKSYKLFGNKIVVHFRELINEGSLIYQEEGNIVLSTDPEKATLQRMFSMDRISFRRHCCGLEKLVVAENEIVIPPLSEWISHTNGDVGEALSLLENFVRTKCYPSESVLMAAGNLWAQFEGLVTALWLDQSFYNGAP